MDLFVTAANTDMGKTVVTAAIAAACLGPDDGGGARPEVAVVKPVQTGSPPDDDAAFVTSATGATPYVFERFEPAVGPATCAVLEGRDLSVANLVRRTLAVHADVRLCEAAGGFLSPLTEDATMADLAIALGWPVVLAVRADLGTLGLTGLVVEAIRARDLPLVGLVVSDYTGAFPEDDNLERLSRIAPVLGVVPHLDDPTHVGSATNWHNPPPW
jgi:dethiobiotin synthetase